MNQASSSDRWAVVSKIVAATVGIYLIQLATRQPNQDSIVFQWAAAESGLILESGQVWRLLTYAFCHSETHLFHITFNMLALFFLGRLVAHTLGNREFLWMYLAAAIFSGIVQTCSMKLSNPVGPNWAIGASGAVSAVFFLFACYFPQLKLYVFGVVPVKAKYLISIIAAYDLLGLFRLLPEQLAPAGATVGHSAHLAGMLFGFFYFRWEMRITRWWDVFAGRVKTSPVPSLPKTQLKVYNPESQPEIDFSDRVDAVLEKIHREGEASLSERERRILTQASQHMKSSK